MRGLTYTLGKSEARLPGRPKSFAQLAMTQPSVVVLALAVTTAVGSLPADGELPRVSRSSCVHLVAIRVFGVHLQHIVTTLRVWRRAYNDVPCSTCARRSREDVKDAFSASKDSMVRLCSCAALRRSSSSLDTAGGGDNTGGGGWWCARRGVGTAIGAGRGSDSTRVRPESHESEPLTPGPFENLARQTRKHAR